MLLSLSAVIMKNCLHIYKMYVANQLVICCVIYLLATKWETCKGRWLFFTLGFEFGSMYLFTLGFEFAHTSFHCGVRVCPYIFSLWGSNLPIHLFTVGSKFAHTSFHSGI